jgi:hypothetical protein
MKRSRDGMVMMKTSSKRAKEVRGRPFAVGDPRINRKGRPRIGNSLAEALREYLEGKEKGSTRKTALVEKLYLAALGDNCVPAARLIVETLGALDLEARFAAIEKALDRIEGARR